MQEQPVPGVTARDCENGARYLRIHYSADPSKDATWAQRERVKVPAREWMREMEMDETVYQGEPVFADYRDAWHNRFGNEPLPIVRGAQYIAGWDCGQTITPAFVLLQVTPRPWQVHALLEVVSPGGEPMETFAPRVMKALCQRTPATWDEVEHWGDATVATRNGVNGETAAMAAARHGFRIRPASNEIAGRLNAVVWLLTNDVDDRTPRLLIDGHHCPILREGMRGAYRYDEAAASQGVGPGRILKETPKKDGFSHVQDALQYAALRVRRMLRAGNATRTDRRREWQ